MSSIAIRSNTSVRSLQQGFRRHLGISPMTYLREVRLRRAHQTLLESDPSTVSVAYRWATATSVGSPPHTLPAPPAKALRRKAS
jgi:transcriptional regulator GlxA family with amidase domain